MNYRALIPGIVCERLDEVRDFYEQKLGFEISFENDWYLGLRDGVGGVELAFSLPVRPDQAPFSGKGLTLCLQVGDADEHYRNLTAAGVAIEAPPVDNPWGDRSFRAIDPAGVALYFFHPIEPAENYRQSFK